jgi:phosphonate transport system permease protein
MSATALPAAPAYVPPSAQFRRRLGGFLGVAAFLVGSGVFLGFKPWLLVTDFHYIVKLAGEMVPPNLAMLWEKASLRASVAETVAMAFLGTLVGGCAALGLAFFAAANTAPHPAVRVAVRALFQCERATPNLITALVLLVAVGFGPFAGFLALTIGSLGMFGKLFADAIEQVDAGPTEAVASVGATRWQVIRFAIVPQVMPAVVGNLFYAFDVNLRLAIALGIYGAGGLGFELQLAMKVLRYPDVLALVLLIVVLITAMERVSDFIRRRLIGADTLK